MSVAATLESRKQGAACTSPDDDPIALYLGLLKRSLTNTLGRQEPNADAENQYAYVRDFAHHYVRGGAISMLPMARLDNIQACITAILHDGVPGDLIEAGVWRGGATIFMRGVLKAHGVTDRKVWVADSFEGLPAPDPNRFPREAAAHDGVVFQKVFNHFRAGLLEVKTNFETYGLLDDSVAFLPGWFKDTLPHAPTGPLALARLDGDYYESTRDALLHLYGRLSPGGFLIVDDYGEDAWTHCRQAVDEFRLEAGISDQLVAVDSKCAYWRKS